LSKVSNFFNETLIFGDFLKKKCRFIFVAQGEVLARGKNGGKRIGKNKGVRRFSLFSSSLGVGYALCATQMNRHFFFKKSPKISVSLKNLKLCSIVDDYVIYRLCKFEVKIAKFEFLAIFKLTLT